MDNETNNQKMEKSSDAGLEQNQTNHSGTAEVDAGTDIRAELTDRLVNDPVFSALANAIGQLWTKVFGNSQENPFTIDAIVSHIERKRDSEK